MPWKPSQPGEKPTLGWYVLDFMTEYLAAPARGFYEPFVPYQEQAEFILAWYEIDPLTGRFRYNKGVLGRPRGWGKSPILAGLAIVEGLADVVFDGWNAEGQPIGRPWSDFKTPRVQIAAVSEEQTSNTWQPLLEMLREGPACDEFPGLEPMETFVNLPRGQIQQLTSSARTTKGAPATAAFLDQTEEWVPSNGGPRFAQTIRTNVSKNGGRTIESPNAYIPGERSVAEDSAVHWVNVQQKRETGSSMKIDSILYDHREAPGATDMSERESLLAGLRVAYGDSSGHPDGCVIHDPPCPPGHMDLEDLMIRIWDPTNDVQIARSDFLNQITHASDSWVTKPEWTGCEDLNKVVKDKEQIVLGFDGSRGRKRGRADATALIGCRVSDGHLFEIKVWEQPLGPAGRDWLPSMLEVDAKVREAFDRWRVVGFYADPSGWDQQVAAWESLYGRRLRVKSTARAPIAAWPRSKDTRVVEYLERLRQAIANRELTHDGGPYLTQHVLNARQRTSRTGTLIYKAYPDSPDKIDAAYAAMLAWKARADAISNGIGRQQHSTRRAVVMA